MRYNERAASEIIGALVLTGVIVALFAIITTVIISQPPPVLLPASEFNLTIDDPSVPDHTINISHKRGDSFLVFDESGNYIRDSFYVKVGDDEWNIQKTGPVTNPHTFLLIKGSNTDGRSFSPGDELSGRYEKTDYSGGKPENVQFIYRAPEGGEYLLWGTADSGTGGRRGISFSFINNPCMGSSVTFRDTSSLPATSWEWSFGDGTANSTEQHPTHHYSSCGQKTVILTIRDDTTTLSLSKIITIQPPRAAIRASKTFVSMNEPVYFSDNETYCDQNVQQWDFGDGRTDSIENPVHSYSSPGVYTVTLTEGAGDCSSTTTQTITVSDCVNVTGAAIKLPPVPIYDITHATFRFTSLYSTGTSLRYDWNFSDGTGNTSEQNPTHTFPVPGKEYVITLTISNYCSSDSDTTKLFVPHTPSSCPPVKPTITAPDTGYPNLVISMNGSADPGLGASINTSSYRWDFGDGSSSSGEVTTHQYTQPGEYHISLNASNDCGRTGTATHTITITCSPVTTDFTTNVSTGVAPLAVAFTDTSTSAKPITQWQWNFGDGTTNATTQNPTHTFTTPDTYQVTLTATNECGQSNTIVYAITVTCPPVSAGFTTNTSSGVAPLAIAFTDTSTSARPITQWQWDFGDGTTNATNQNPTHTFNNPGTYQVTLTAANGCGQLSTIAHVITITCPSIIAGFTTNTTSGPAPLTVAFTDTSTSARPITQWQWNFGDGTTNATNQNPTHTFNNPGTYQVNLTATNECDNRDQVTYAITVSCPLVIANFTTNTSSGPAPLTVGFTDTSTSARLINQWQWSFGDGTANATIQNPTHTFNNPGTYQVNLTATNECGQVSTISYAITVTCPPVTAGFTTNTTSGPAPLTVAFNDTSSSAIPVNQWQWDFGDGTANATIQNPAHTFTNPGTYQVTLTATNDCGQFSTIAYAITVTCPPVTAGFTTNTSSGTAPLTVAFTDTSTSARPINQWQWNFGDGTANATTQNPTHTFTAPGTYQVNLTATNECGRFSTIAFAITVTCPPVTAGFTTNVSTGYPPLTVAFTDTSTSARPINQWQWNFGDGTANATIQNPTHTFTNPGTYQVTLTATNECGLFNTIAYVITVTCPPVTAGFMTNVSTGYPPLTVAFTDTSTSARPINQWQWNFGDGTVNATNKNPTHTFTNPGTYQVTLTATNECGQYASTSQVITVSSCYRIINASASTGGTISPTGQVQVTCGASQTFTITPASGYITTDVIVNGISQGSLSTYTFTNVQQNHTIHAEFFSPTDLCAITGFVTNATTGLGVGGIRVEVYNQARTILLRSGVSQPNGYYEIIQQPQQGQRLDITSPDTATWVTTFPASKWYDDILFNPGAKCGAENINFSGIQIVPSPGNFLYNAPKSAAILAGGMIEFQVSPPVNNNAYIIVNNVRYDFLVGDLITIRLLSAQNSGNVIYMSQNGEGHSITTFAFGNAAIYKNRSLLASGQINGINIPKAVSLISTLVLNIPAGQNAWTTFSWGGNPVFPTGQNSQGVTIYNLRPGTDGILNINLDNIYAQGAGDRYQLF